MVKFPFSPIVSPKVKHKTITAITHFSTLFHIPKIPKPNLLSHEPSPQLHWWRLQIRSEMATMVTVSFSYLSLQLVSLFYPTNG